MTAPTLSPLFDLALEELLDGDVTCATQGCDTGATHIRIHGACQVHHCPLHTAANRQIVAHYTIAGQRIRCPQCGDQRVAPRAITFRPI